MLWDPQGNRHYSSALEGIQFLRDNSKSLVRWLHECREDGGRLIHFPQYRSLINDIANVTIRWIDEQERRRTALEERIAELQKELSAARTQAK